mgnify:CR=1 FL=1
MQTLCPPRFCEIDAQTTVLPDHHKIRHGGTCLLGQPNKYLVCGHLQVGKPPLDMLTNVRICKPVVRGLPRTLR